MNSELAELLFGAASALSAVMGPAEPPPPPPPVVVETTAHVGSESLEVTVDVVDGETVFDLDNDVLYEDEPGWHCPTMGNRRCGTVGPNGEDWWYEYDELGETIVDEGPVIPGPPPVPDAWDELAERDDVIVVDLEQIENRLVMTCLTLDGQEVDLDAIAFTVGHWQSCYPIGGSEVEGFGL